MKSPRSQRNRDKEERGEGGGGGGGGEDASVPQRTLESLSQVDRSSNGFFFGDGWDLKRIVLQEG